MLMRRKRKDDVRMLRRVRKKRLRAKSKFMRTAGEPVKAMRGGKLVRLRDDPEDEMGDTYSLSRMAFK